MCACACVCVCVYVCGRACARLCVRVCVCVCASNSLDVQVMSVSTVDKLLFTDSELNAVTMWACTLSLKSRATVSTRR